MWIDAKRQLPKIYESVLFWYDDEFHVGKYLGINRFDESLWQSHIDGYNCVSNVSYWLPLPPSPNEEHISDCTKIDETNVKLLQDLYAPLVKSWNERFNEKYLKALGDAYINGIGIVDANLSQKKDDANLSQNQTSNYCIRSDNIPEMPISFDKDMLSKYKLSSMD